MFLNVKRYYFSAAAWFFTASWLYQAGIANAALDHGEDGSGKPDVVGAGAHFSWVIFHDLKEDLEKKTGRKITLYGKDSSLGMGCNAGIKNARHYTHDHETFGFICCQLDDKEVKDKNLNVHPLAYEPVLILVNESNPVENLSSEQARKIFRGEIRNWAEVGGEDKAIVVITRLHCKNRPGHWKRILPKAELFRKDRLNVTGADDMVKKVSDFSGAIGHTGSTWMFGVNDKVKAVKIDGYAPTAENLAAKTYPFYRTLSAVTLQGARGDILKLIQEVQKGSAFQKVAQKYELLQIKATTP